LKKLIRANVVVIVRNSPTNQKNKCLLFTVPLRQSNQPSKEIGKRRNIKVDNSFQLIVPAVYTEPTAPILGTEFFGLFRDVAVVVRLM